MKELGHDSRFSNKDPNRAIPHIPKNYSLLSVSFIASRKETDLRDIPTGP